MTCKRCGVEYSKPTETMKKYNLCINCVMEWHRNGAGSTLEKFSKTKRESHFKI